VLLDTNVLIRHLTGEPADQAQRATAFLAAADRLELPDLVVAEIVYVLESVYRRPRREVVVQVRAVLAHPPVEAGNEQLVLRAVELYETTGIHFAEAYLAACAENSDGIIVSFDQAVDGIESVFRLEP
jgi:predicted nucleic acid-binding protein